MRKILVKGDTYFLIEDTKSNSITIDGAEIFDVSDMSKKEFVKLRENPQMARDKIKVLRKA